MLILLLVTATKRNIEDLFMYLVRFEEISRRSEPQNDDMSHTHTIQHPLQIQRSTSSEPIEQVAMLASVRQAKENFVKSKYGDHGSKDDVVFDEIVIVCAVTDQYDNEWVNLLSSYCDEVLTLPRNVRIHT